MLQIVYKATELQLLGFWFCKYSLQLKSTSVLQVMLNLFINNLFTLIMILKKCLGLLIICFHILGRMLKCLVDWGKDFKMFSHSGQNSKCLICTGQALKYLVILGRKLKTSHIGPDIKIPSYSGKKVED